MSIEHGFELIEHRSLPELNSEAYRYRHVKTGAELLSLVNDDSNKSFGVAFRTPPEDSTGIAHILGLEADNTALHHDNTGLRSRNADLKTSNAALRASNTALENDNTALRARGHHSRSAG